MMMMNATMKRHLVPMTTALAQHAIRPRPQMIARNYRVTVAFEPISTRRYYATPASNNDDAAASDNEWPTTESPQQHPSSYFTVFGLTPEYSISLDKLQKIYKKLMVENHPDKHHGSSHENRQKTDNKAAVVTRAYETLRHPQSRALHLLEVSGHPVDETSTGKLVGQDFLMKVMEVREQIDHTHGDEQLRPLWESNQQRIQSLSQDLAHAFELNPPDMGTALRLTAMLQYWYRVEEKMLEKMEEIPESP